MWYVLTATASALINDESCGHEPRWANEAHNLRMLSSTLRAAITRRSADGASMGGRPMMEDSEACSRPGVSPALSLRGSLVAERPALNRKAAGSNPAPAANMVTMVYRLRLRVVNPARRVRFPLVTLTPLYPNGRGTRLVLAEVWALREHGGMADTRRLKSG